MTFDWFDFQHIPHLETTLALPGYLAVLALAALTVALGVQRYSDFARLSALRWAVLVIAILLAPLLAQMLIVRLESPAWLTGVSVSLLGLLPVVVAALALGPAPALLVGLSVGLTWALFGTSRLTQPFEVALVSFVTASLVNQRYQGALAGWLRRPLIAALGAVIVVGWPLQLAAIFLTGPTPALVSLEHMLTALLPTLIAAVLGAAVAGLLVEIVLLRWPKLHPAYGRELHTPPWRQHLSYRMLYILVPLTALAIVGLVSVVAYTSYQVATRLVVDQMARDAANAGNGIPFFVQMGRSLIRVLSQDERLLTDDGEARQTDLEEGLRAVPFFQQLVYVDADRNVVSAYPDIASTAPTFSPEEGSRLRLTLEDNVPAEVIVYGQGQVMVSFIAVVSDPRTGRPAGALVGRTSLDNNPTLVSVVDLLREGFVASGEGLIVDTQNRILLYPAHPELVQSTFSLGRAVEVPVADSAGQAFREMQPDGTRRLIYMQPVAGRSDWSVIVSVPNSVALALAVQIALPTLVFLVVSAAVVFPLLIAAIRRVTVPLERLLQAVDLIAEGQLDHPVQVVGEDEIGRLGRAFDVMRLRLKARLDEQERLLRISRGVSATLELFRATPPILSSALDVTHARGARIVLRRGADHPLQVYAAGEAAAALAALDSQLIDLVERQGTVVISQVWRASGSLDITALPTYIRAIVALPLRSETSFHGILWLGYDHEHAFEQAEMTFLSTLASQAAIAVANSRLFTEAEEGRRKLEAVLTSTADGMIVTDNQGRIVLVNPAAEQYFGLRGEQVRGHKASEVINVPDLAALLTNLEEPVATLEFPDGHSKTLLANTSTIVSHDGAITGRVAVLRDITALKELDSIKSVFLQMVSHDLRSPLTYMRGYLSMLPLSGDLNDSQRDSIAKINTGIEHISEMTERLHYLSRLQFGDEAELELALVDVEEMLKEVCQEQSRLAQDKKITLRAEVKEKLPLLLVDAMLYRHAIMNLVNNALKYTPDGGEVVARAFTEASERLNMSVSDNGVGIRQEDQARLFEAFYRVPPREGEPPRPRGTGLGLALVKAIAEAHGGTVGVESTFGKGSTFHITLPVRRPDELK